MEKIRKDSEIKLLTPCNKLFVYFEGSHVAQLTQDYNTMLQMHSGLSTENRQSPIQLYTSGVLANANSGYSAVASILEESNFETYGVDPDGPFPSTFLLVFYETSSCPCINSILWFGFCGIPCIALDRTVLR